MIGSGISGIVFLFKFLQHFFYFSMWLTYLHFYPTYPTYPTFFFLFKTNIILYQGFFNTFLKIRFKINLIMFYYPTVYPTPFFLSHCLKKSILKEMFLKDRYIWTYRINTNMI